MLSSKCWKVRLLRVFMNALDFFASASLAVAEQTWTIKLNINSTWWSTFHSEILFRQEGSSRNLYGQTWRHFQIKIRITCSTRGKNTIGRWMLQKKIPFLLGAFSFWICSFSFGTFLSKSNVRSKRMKGLEQIGEIGCYTRNVVFRLGVYICAKCCFSKLKRA